jgi:UPF0755 protein
MKPKSLQNVPLIFAKIQYALFLIFSYLIYLLKTSWIFKTLIFIVIIVIISRFIWFQPLHEDLNNFPMDSIKIPVGKSFKQIADTLEKRGYIKNKKLFLYMGILTGKDKNVKAGFVQIPRGLSDWQLLNYLENAKIAAVKVTLPEGISSRQIASILNKKIEIDSLRFISLLVDSNFIQSFGLETNSLDGYLLPDTYFFYWRMSEEEVISSLVEKTKVIFDADSVRVRMNELDMDINEILTLASIIEGETIIDSERVVVSSVYHNRLKRGWLLQADPTIQYLIPDAPRRLTYRDLKIDSPFNTYKYRGLPPAPINNPGINSILAALFPEETQYMYFVAVGDGSHHFSTTSREHNNWKRKFNEVRKRVRREEKKSKSRSQQSNYKK